MKRSTCIHFFLIVFFHPSFDCEMKVTHPPTGNHHREHGVEERYYPVFSPRYENGGENEPSALNRRQVNGNKPDFKELSEEFLALGRSSNLSVSCNQTQERCFLHVEEGGVSGAYIWQRANLLLFLGLVNIPQPNHTDTTVEPMKYHNPLLGMVQPDEPLRLVTGLFPWDDLKMGTIFILRYASRCPGRRRQKACIRQIHIHYENISSWADSISGCDSLTVTIHGWNSAQLREINKSISPYQVKLDRFSCNLMVNWSQGAKAEIFKEKTEVYAQPGEARWRVQSTSSDIQSLNVIDSGKCDNGWQANCSAVVRDDELEQSPGERHSSDRSLTRGTGVSLCKSMVSSSH